MISNNVNIDKTAFDGCNNTLIIDYSNDIKEEPKYDILSVEKNIDTLKTVSGIIKKESISLKTEPKSTIGARQSNEHKNLLKDDGIFKRNRNKIFFGNYPQGKNGECAPIEWDILEEKNGKAMIISHYILDSLTFGQKNNYKNSSIRRWLNNTFFDIAFTDKEKEIIESTTVNNSAGSTGHKKNKFACEHTNDKVFLLSYEEAVLFYKKKELRRAKGTTYAMKKNLYVESGTEYGNWLLRSPGCGKKTRVKCIFVNGEFHNHDVGYGKDGVRPVLWLDLNKKNKE